MSSTECRKQKIAIIGASYLQLPLIVKAKEMGLETHVFAWEVGDEGERVADFFYPISTVEKEIILETCVKIGIDGICSIASDLATITVNFVANAMGLIGNSPFCSEVSTNKYKMRMRFAECGDPSPKSTLVASPEDYLDSNPAFPLIVKPVDRSGSRGIAKVVEYDQIKPAIQDAIGLSFSKKALVEEFVEGREFSVEYLSWKGQHHFLAITQKYTTGAPHFIETGHLEPASLEPGVVENVKKTVEHALNSLQIEYGASHSEIIIDRENQIWIVEIGSRMGGDFIGSYLVEASTGIDFVKNVVLVALGIKPDRIAPTIKRKAAIRFVFTEEDLETLSLIQNSFPQYKVISSVDVMDDRVILDSSSRYGYFAWSGPMEDDFSQFFNTKSVEVSPC